MGEVDICLTLTLTLTLTLALTLTLTVRVLAHVCTWNNDYLHGMLCSDESTSQESWGLGIQSFGEGLGGYQAFGYLIEDPYVP
jgi:hypothetical protein